jgi:hypothetical protein
MTTQKTRKPRRMLIQFANTVTGTLRNLERELLGAGGAMARANRFPQSQPPRVAKPTGALSAR